MNRNRVVVIGGGAAGAWQLLSLLRNGIRCVDVVEPRPSIGRGVAYSTTSDLHLINVPAEKMDQLTEPSDPLFVNWLRQNAPEFGSQDYPPRRLYGDFLEGAVAESSRDADVRHVRVSANSVHRDEMGFVVRLRCGASLPACAVVLALGNLPPPRLAPGADDAAIVENPWAIDLDLAASAGHVLIAGTGLTALDTVVSIASVNQNARITMTAARPFSPPEDRVVPLWSAGSNLPGRSALEVWRAANRAIQSYPDPAVGWYEVVDGIRPHVEEIWAGWSDRDRQSFVRHGARRWLHHRHRAPPPTSRTVRDLMESGRLTIRAGRVGTVRRRAHQVEAMVGADTLSADVVVNATGPSLDLRSHPLLADGLASGLLSPCPIGLGVAVSETSSVRNAAGESVPGLYALGTLTRGAFFEVVAATNIRRRSSMIAAELSGCS